MTNEFRPILPGHPSLEPVGSHRTKSSPRKASAGPVCDRCRLKKQRCNRKRPACSLCLANNTQCSYNTGHRTNLEKRHPDLLAVLDQLISAPEAEAIDILKRLRRTGDLSSSLSCYKPSTVRTCRSMSPPVFSALEFELTASHQSVFPNQFPIDTSRINLDYLYKIPAAGTVAVGPSRVNHLQDVDVRYWTSVDISDELAATLISTYLQHNHSMFGFFDVELFFNDLKRKRLRFCSSFLVNAVLSCATLWYCSIDSSVSKLSSDFISVTESLWRAERSCDSLLNVAAIMAYSVACEIQVCNVSVIDLLEDGRSMAERLGLFSVKDHNEKVNIYRNLGGEETQDWRPDTAQVAWGAYSWLSLNLYFNPIKPISFPPRFLIPGSKAASVKAGKWVGKSFAARCEFWTIIQEVAAVYSLYRPRSGSYLTLSFVESKYRKLLHWADTLDEDMLRCDQCPDDVLLLHMFFHSAILDIFGPFSQKGGDHKLHSFTSVNSSVKDVLRASVNQLKRILISCRLTHQSVLHMMLGGTGVIHVCNMMIRDFSRSGNRQLIPCSSEPSSSRNAESEPEPLHDPDWRFYFLLCVAHCQDLVSCAPVITSVGRGLLAMAMKTGALTANEALPLFQTLQIRARHHTAASKREFGAFVLDFDLAARAPEAAQVEVVAAKFEDLILFDTFTENRDFAQKE